MTEQRITVDAYQAYCGYRIANKPYLFFTPTERLVPRRRFLCENCIGACCMLTKINSLSFDELKFISAATFPLEIVELINIRTPEDLEALYSFQHPSLSLSYYANGLLALHNIFENNPKKRSCSISPATTCGYLTDNGRCGTYHTRPRTCCDFKPGCATCRNVYIGKGSEAAVAYGEALNVGEQVLGIIDPNYKARVFDFH